MREIVKRFLYVEVVSFISDEYFTFRAMFAPGQEVSITDGCAVICYSVYYISFLQKTISKILLAFSCSCTSFL